MATSPLLGDAATGRTPPERRTPPAARLPRGSLPASGVILNEAYRLVVNGSATRLYSHSYMLSGQDQAIRRHVQRCAAHIALPAFPHHDVVPMFRPSIVSGCNEQAATVWQCSTQLNSMRQAYLSEPVAVCYAAFAACRLFAANGDADEHVIISPCFNTGFNQTCASLAPSTAAACYMLARCSHARLAH